VKNASAVDGGVASYPGFYISGFTCDSSLSLPDAGGGGGSLILDGDLVTTAANLGDTATGIATSGTAGSGSTFGTVTQTGKVFTTNALRGYLIETLAGTGSGQVRGISSNTATVITVVGTWTAPGAGTTYAIREPGWKIITSVPTPASGISAAAGGTTGAAIFVGGNNCTQRVNSIALRNVGIQNTDGAPALRYTDGSYLGVLQARIVGTSNGIFGSTGIASRLSLTDVTYTSSATTFSAVDSDGRLSLNRVLSYGSNKTLLLASNGVSLTMTSCEASNSTTAGALITEANGTISGSRFDCATSGGVGVAIGNSPGSVTTTGTVSVSLSTNALGGTCGIGIAAVGPGAMAGVSDLTGTAATTAFLANFGGRISVSGTTPTGGTQDVSLDNGAFVAALGDVSACQISDGGVSKYDSRLCK
jgi:hypothetical protein